MTSKWTEQLRRNNPSAQQQVCLGKHQDTYRSLLGHNNVPEIGWILNRSASAQPDDGHVAFHHCTAFPNNKVHVCEPHASANDADWDTFHGPGEGCESTVACVHKDIPVNDHQRL